MHLVPTHDEVVDLLRRTGGLREGHFEYINGLHANEYLQVALTMRYYDAAKVLSVGLSRQLRANSEIRAIIPELSIVAPATGGLPVAYGVCEALRAHQVYWAERENANEPQRFRQYLELKKREKVLLVDDILRSGKKLAELKKLVEDSGGEVVDLLRRTGGLREGHFEYINGLHANEYLQVALTMRYYDAAKVLSVGLSRQLRANSEIRAIIPELSIVAPATGGLPVAYGVCEALRAHQVYWAERENANEPQRFRQYLELKKGEKVLLVDDILRTGKKLAELKKLVEDSGGEVVGLAVVIYQPNPTTPSFDPLPFYYLAKLDATYYKDAASCDLCKKGAPVDKVWL